LAKNIREKNTNTWKTKIKKENIHAHRKTQDIQNQAENRKKETKYITIHQQQSTACMQGVPIINNPLYCSKGARGFEPNYITKVVGK